MSLRWFETHAHLSDGKFDSDRDAAIARARQAGIIGIVEIADGPTEWPHAKALAARNKDVWWAAGLHPYYADQASVDVWEQLAQIVDDRFVAVGEIGLDYAKSTVPKEHQIPAFEQALDVADRLNKPVVIHCRDAYDDLMPILRRRTPTRRSATVPGVVHCFSGNADNARELVSLGYLLGVDGPITYPSANVLRDAVAKIPLEFLVLETDSPYLPPQTKRGQRNEPACLPEIGLRLAQVIGRTPAVASDAWVENSLRLFGIKID